MKNQNRNDSRRCCIVALTCLVCVMSTAFSSRLCMAQGNRETILAELSDEYIPGLLATYKDTQGNQAKRVDAIVSFHWAQQSPDTRLVGTQFEATWKGFLFFQSVGIIAYLISITYFVTGINILIIKEFFLIIENTFFATLYNVFGTLFLTNFYSEGFTLYINGNGGFIGNYLNQTFLHSLVLINENIFYYILIFIILILFLISINFNSKKFITLILKIFSLVFKKNNKNYTDKSEIINEYIPQDEIKNLIQEDLPFIKNENKNEKLVVIELGDLLLNNCLNIENALFLKESLPIRKEWILAMNNLGFKTSKLDKMLLLYKFNERK